MNERESKYIGGITCGCRFIPTVWPDRPAGAPWMKKHEIYRMKILDPGAYYLKECKSHESAGDFLSRRIDQVSMLRLIVVVAILPTGYFAYSRHSVPLCCAAFLLAAVFLLLINIHNRLIKRKSRIKILLEIIAGEMAALGGNTEAFGDGSPHIDPDHPYSSDLDLFGRRSVYQLINRTVTLKGGADLGNQLKNIEKDKNTIIRKQRIVSELAADPQFLLGFRASGRSVPEAADDHASMMTWLSAENEFPNGMLINAAFYLLPVLTAGLAIASILYRHYYLLFPVCLNWIILFSYRKKIKRGDAGIGRTAQLVKKYQQLQNVTAAAGFDDSWLKAVSQQCREFSGHLRRFCRLATMFNRRNETIGGVFLNTFFLYDLLFLIQLEKWREKNGEAFIRSLDAMIALDVYVSCGTYAFNNPSHTFPAVTDDPGASVIDAQALRHPLLPPDAVGNSFTLGENERLYLLTGANMTGKSTFMRTVGVNLIMAYNGLPVPAAGLSVPVLSIFTSMRINDSVQDDTSYFRAELIRIKALIDSLAPDGSRHLILLDEPLRGTNAQDKQQGTRSIINVLVKQGTLGIVATHDTELCLAAGDDNGQISNYHFESAVTAEGLTFDYKIRPGVSQSTNATTLMRQMGIIE